MGNLVSLFGFFGLAFICAYGLGSLLILLIRSGRGRLHPKPNAAMRIRAGSAFYRSRFISAGASTWEVTAPLQRDNYVPIRVGEEVVVEAAGDRGALVFRTTVMARETEPHRLILRAPARIHEVERREHRRWPQFSDSEAKVEGQDAQVLDLSEGGARVRLARLRKGDRVRLDLPFVNEPLFAWVLETEADVARLRFEELLDLRISPKRRTAPAF